MLWQEPGRTLVGEAGTTLYTVGVLKKVSTFPKRRAVRALYAAIDGGMSDNPRPQLYDAVYEVLNGKPRRAKPKTQTVAIAGKHCETDILIQAAETQPLQTGDILAVQSTGRVQLRDGIQLQPLHQTRLRFRRQNGQADLVSRRETLDDVVRLDIVPARLG